MMGMGVGFGVVGVELLHPQSTKKVVDVLLTVGEPPSGSRPVEAMHGVLEVDVGICVFLQRQGHGW